MQWEMLKGLTAIRLPLVQPRFAVFIVFQAPICMSEHLC